MSLDAHYSKIKEAIYADIDKSKTVVFQGLLDNPTVNSIPESLFVNYFLPFFIGQRQSPNWVMEWISIAGTPMAEVAIVKDNTNVHLFNVPSLLYTNNLFMHKSAGDLGDIFGRYEQINGNLPGTGLSYLITALNSKNNELLQSLDMTGVNARWVQILQMYGIISNVLPVGNAPTQQPKQSDDMFEY